MAEDGKKHAMYEAEKMFSTSKQTMDKNLLLGQETVSSAVYSGGR